MIDSEIAAEAVPLLSTVLAVMVEDEEPAMLSGRRRGSDLAAYAERMRVLGADMAAVASAMEVILRRSRSDSPS